MWRRVWQMACREEQIPDVGDSIVYDVAGFSLDRACAAPPTRSGPSTTPVCTGARGCAPSPGTSTSCAVPSTASPGTSTAPSRACRARGTSPTSTRPPSACPRRGVGRWGGFVFVNHRPRRGRASRTTSRSCPSTSRRGTSRSATSPPTSCASSPATGRWRSRPSSRATTPSPSIPSCSRPAATPRPQYDVYQGVRHVNRMITPVGIASEHVDRAVGEQDILDAMFLTKDDPDACVPEGATARQVLAERTRRQLAERTGGDYSRHHRLRGARRHRVLRLPQLRALGGLHDPSRLPVPAPRRRPHAPR